MLFCPNGLYAHKDTGMDDGLLADYSELAHGRLYSLDGLFTSINHAGVIHRVIHGSYRHVDICY